MKKDVLFIWIPKVAGTSIYHILNKYNCSKLKDNKNTQDFENSGFVTFGHRSIPYLLETNVISKDYLKKSFKFCFVRNPWDRLVSLYCYTQYDKKMSFEKFVLLIQLKYRLQRIFISRLFQFIFNKFPRITAKLHADPQINYFDYILPLPNVGFYNVLGLSQANPQVAWITDKENNIMVDYIGKIENIKSDSEKIFKIIGIKEELPHLNKRNHKKYQEYYTSKTRKIVEEIYKEDIKTFHYNF